MFEQESQLPPNLTPSHYPPHAECWEYLGGTWEVNTWWWEMGGHSQTPVSYGAAAGGVDSVSILGCLTAQPDKGLASLSQRERPKNIGCCSPSLNTIERDALPLSRVHNQRCLPSAPARKVPAPRLTMCPRQRRRSMDFALDPRTSPTVHGVAKVMTLRLTASPASFGSSSDLLLACSHQDQERPHHQSQSKEAIRQDQG
jgi:hypothetical protein